MFGWDSSAQSRISRRKRAIWFSTSAAASPLPEAEGLDRDVLPGRELTSLVDLPEATFPELGKYLVPALEDGID